MADVQRSVMSVAGDLQQKLKLASIGTGESMNALTDRLLAEAFENHPELVFTLQPAGDSGKGSK